MHPKNKMADFRYNHPEAEEAEFVSGSPEIVFEGKNLYHPFLGAKAVKNDFNIKDDNYYIITGVQTTHHFIDSIVINKKEVNYDATKAHFYIYFGNRH